MKALFWVADFQLLIGRRSGPLFEVSFIRALFPFMETPSCAPITSQRPRLLIITLAIRISTYDFEGEHGLSVHLLQAFMGKVNISSLWLHSDPLL